VKWKPKSLVPPVPMLDPDESEDCPVDSHGPAIVVGDTIRLDAGCVFQVFAVRIADRMLHYRIDPVEAVWVGRDCVVAKLVPKGPHATSSLSWRYRLLADC